MALLRGVLSSGVGRAGVALLLSLVVLSIGVVLTFPPGFGLTRWGDPAVWADNPKAVPPVWTNVLGGSAAEHRTLSIGAPVDVRQSGPAELRTWELPFAQGTGALPTFLSFTLGRVDYAGRPPSYRLLLVRPDGVEIPLVRDVVRGPRPGETGPYVRYADEPYRVLISSDPAVTEEAADALGAQYGVTIDPASLRGRPEVALFGVPDGAGGYTPLAGDYRFRLAFAFADPADVLAEAKVVLGGSVYGWAGTDTQGRDLMEGLLFGLPIALLIGISAAFVSTAIGTALGLISGFKGGRIDLLIQGAADIINNVPLLPLLIFMVFVLGSQLWLILLVLVAFSWPGLTITIRSMVLGLSTGSEVEAARALGASTGRILRKHIFPHTAPFVVTQMIFFVPGAILAEAGLSFLGLGDPSLPTWGQILEDGFRTGAVFLGYWWWVLGPGLALVITSVTFMLLAIALEPVVNPRLRGGDRG